MTGSDLVVVMLPGVQKFVGESRSIGDVAVSSQVMSELVRGMLDEVPTGDLVFPTPDAGRELPNRIVFLAPQGTGTGLAEAAGTAVRRAWEQLCRRAVARGRDQDRLAQDRLVAQLVAESAGFPAIRWVVVSASDGGYGEQWKAATDAVAARKRIRDFPAVDRRPDGGTRLRICSLSGRWAEASVMTAAQPRLNVPVRSRRGEALSAPAVVKRAYAQSRAPQGGYPSTWSVATASFRRDVLAVAPHRAPLLAAVAGLRHAVNDVADLGVRPGSGRLPGLRADDDNPDLRWLSEIDGLWLLPQTWESAALARESGIPAGTLMAACTAGRKAATTLTAAAAAAGGRAPTPYLAVITQDADHMGRRLSRTPRDRTVELRDWHGEVSAALVAAAAAQRGRLEEPDLLGWTVYAGGDDLLGFVPARTALAAVEELNACFTTSTGQVLPGVTASAAVVFFHASWPLQSALAAARELLNEAKRSGRPGLGLAALRRGGERVRLVRSLNADPPAPPGTATVPHLRTLVDAMAGGLSGRLAAGLERDRDQLAELSDVWFAREVRRLIARHSDRSGKADPGPDPDGTAAGRAAFDVDAVADALIAVSGRDPQRRLSADAAALTRFVASEGW